MRVGYFQFRPAFGKPEANCRRILQALADVEADLVVIPELPFTGYLFRNRRELAAMAEDPRSSSIVSIMPITALVSKRTPRSAS